MVRKKINDEKSGKSLHSEKDCHKLMARICGKSTTERSLDTYISGTSRTYRDVFVLTAALGVISNEPIIPLPPDSVNTVDNKDIKIEHDNILKIIAYWHKGKVENNQNSHEVLIDQNECRKIGELYCYAGKELLNNLVSSNMFDSELINLIINK